MVYTDSNESKKMRESTKRSLVPYKLVDKTDQKAHDKFSISLSIVIMLISMAAFSLLF